MQLQMLRSRLESAEALLSGHQYPHDPARASPPTLTSFHPPHFFLPPPLPLPSMPEEPVGAHFSATAAATEAATQAKTQAEAESAAKLTQVEEAAAQAAVAVRAEAAAEMESTISALKVEHAAAIAIVRGELSASAAQVDPHSRFTTFI